MVTKVLLKIQNAHYKNNHWRNTVHLWLDSYKGGKELQSLVNVKCYNKARSQ